MPFKIYRSSAGSGKTFTLVKEFLRIALSTDRPDSYRGILAVTFTNKAAEEMKSRVFKTLIKLSSPESDDDAMANALVKELAIEQNQLRKRAGSVLKHMLHHYSDVSIYTLDTFSHKLIRTFAIDLGLSVNFEVELETQPLIQAVFDELMKRVGSEPILSDALIDLIQSTVDDEKSQNIDDRVKKFVKTLFSEESRFHLDQLKRIDLAEFNELRLKLKPRIHKAEMELKSIGQQVCARIEAADLNAQSFAGGRYGILYFFEKLKNGSTDPPGLTVSKNIAADKWYGSKIKADEQQTIDGLRPYLIEEHEKSLALIKQCNYHQLVFDHIYAVALLDEMHQILQSLQIENEVLQIGEFNHLISNEVMTETAPFIYERTGSRYQHFLIDEFQDTSILQWFNLLPLIDESLAHDNLCLVVGDAKQSIYRWRGGDVQQFVELPKIHKPDHIAEKLNSLPATQRIFDLRESTMDLAKQIHHLDTNYRSTKTVVDFNNALFDSMQPLMPGGLEKLYEHASQKSKSDEDGLVNLHFFRQEESGRSWPEYQGLVHEKTKGWIQECLADGFRAGDITILCRSNKDGSAIASYLVSEGYQVVSSDSLLINSSPKVRLMVSLAIYLFEPENGANAAELIKLILEFKNRVHEISEHLVHAGEKSGQAYVREFLKNEYSTIDLEKLYHSDTTTLFSVLNYELFQSETDAYLSFFLDEVLVFSQKKKRSLQDFLSYWTSKREKLSISLEDNGEAIRIMTIHKSKGLEFPVVMHPFADYALSKGSDAVWAYMNDSELLPLDRLFIKVSARLENTPFASDLERERARSAMDMFNQLYVALTRAEKRLYVSGKLRKNPKDDQDPSTAIQFIKYHLSNSGMINADEDSFVIGKRLIQTAQVKTEHGLIALGSGNPYWQDRLQIASPRSETSMDSGTASARQIGIAIHDAMSNINTELDIEKAVNTLIESGRIFQDDSNKFRGHIQTLINRPELKSLFGTDVHVRNEADIQLADGTWLRPDRVVIKDDRAWVIDYKTGEERPSHQKQINDYKTALHQLGYSEVTGLLVYIEAENVLEV